MEKIERPQELITSDMNRRDAIPATPLRFAFFAAKQNALLGVLSILCVTFAQLCGVFLPYVLKKIIDAASAVTGAQTEGVFFWVLMFPTLTFSMFILYRLSGFIGMQWLTRTEAFSYKILFGHLSQHSHTYFSNRFAGSVSNKLAHAAEGTFRLIDGFLWSHYGAFLSLIASGVFIFMTSFWVGVIYVILITVLVPTNYYLAKHRRPYVVEYASMKTGLRGRAVDIITNIGAMRQFSRRLFEFSTLSDSIEKLRSADIKQWKLSEWSLTFNNIIIASSITLMLFVMYARWVDGLVSSGDFVLVLTLLMNLSGTLVFIGNAMTHFIRLYGEVEEGLDEILITHEVTDKEDAQKLEVTEGAIVWKDVRFEYGGKTVFENFNLDIRPGQRLGLVGHSGAGKTTFVSLLLRQHDVHGGSISIDGQNIADVAQDSLRLNISVVPQEPMLFHRSIRENILYGNIDATQEEIEAAAKNAQAHDFIMSLPGGYDTTVGERGIKLSGGQKQRIAIARAMLKDAPILILDEATSALDSESEVEIQKALHTLMEGKTVIAIAHRLSTLREMDRIIVLQEGKIVEDGNHATLSQSNGTYSRLWKHQAGGFLLE
jgi:ATP-binding cassette, subfamily B, bacterial